MMQMFFSEFDTLLLLLRKEERLLLRTKRLQSLLQEILFDPHGCESNTESPLNVHTDCRKVSVALALSEFHDCFSNRLGELCWGSETRFVEHSDVVWNPRGLGILELVYPPSHRRKTTAHSLRDSTLRRSLFPQRDDLGSRHVSCGWT